MGLLSKPVVMNPGRDGGGARQLGYFPDGTVERINKIQLLKREGIFMADIVEQMKSADDAPAATHVAIEPAKISYLAARAGDGADLLICLGDLILFLDYADPSRGIYDDLFGEAHTRAYISARTAGRFEDARSLLLGDFGFGGDFSGDL